ncbi:hypothetical protein HF313_15060 [Massilia atriviolacea]|uniref:Uncharacterized protein n=1 Tax=Massilia atriviolacea TaxID=2495579 RepID=A0A430HR80_9BURK|nr:hypothetical protein [Massilia atriviolacea]RSZ60031.1 hypothetical protein EJB06_07580 [Massilia atriviolacea]
MDKVPKSAGKRPQPKGGSRKGIPNKTTQTAKEAIALAAAQLGGAARLVAWAQEDPLNERAFWTTVYPKLLPLQLTGAGEDGEHLVRNIGVTFIKPNA